MAHGERNTDMMGSWAGDAGGDAVSLSIPKRGGHEFYLAQILGTIRGFSNVLFTMSNNTDPRIIPAARQCIATIPDDKIRYEMLSKFRDYLNKVEKADLNADQKGAVTVEICQILVGEVYSFVDEFFGVSKVNVIAPMSTYPFGRDYAYRDKNGEKIKKKGEQLKESTLVAEPTTAGSLALPLLPDSSASSVSSATTGEPTPGV